MTARRLAAPLLSAALLLLLGACAGSGGARQGAPAPPAWLERPDRHPACGDALLCAVGSASGTGAAAQDSARRRAMQEISASILVDVSAEIVTATRSLLTDAQASWSEELAEDIRLRTEAELPAAEVVEVWKNPATQETSVLVAVPRLALVDNWLPRLESAVGRADELVLQAEAAADRDPVRTLQLLAAAQTAIADVWVLANKLRVVANRTSAAGRVVGPWNRASELFGSLSAEVTRQAGALRLTAVSGDGQRGRIRGHLPAPLVVEARHQDASGAWRPLAGLPLRARPAAPGQADLQPPTGVTGDDGRLRVLAGGLRRVPGADAQIHVFPDLGDAAEPLPGLPEVVFHYSLPAASDVTLLLLGDARLAGEALTEPSLVGRLAGHLGAAGFAVRTLESGGSRAAQLLAAPPSGLAALVDRDVDYVLRARAAVQPSSSSRGLHWFSAVGRVEVIALDDGSVFPVTTEAVKGAHTSPGPEGARRVIERELAPQLERALDEEFTADFREVADISS